MEAEVLEAGGLVWRIRPEERVRLAGFLADPTGWLRRHGPTVIKKNNVRTVFFLPEGGGYFLKWFARGDWREQLKGVVLGTKAAREWAVLARSRALGLPVPEPVLWAERRRRGLHVESFLATRALPGAEDLVPFLRRLGEEERRELLKRLGAAVRQLHAAGLLHRDLHSGNILVLPEDRALRFIDLHRASFRRRLSWRVRRRNLALLCHSLRTVTTPAERRLLLAAYGLEGGRCERTAAWVERRMGRLERRRLRSRSRRCVVESTAFTRVRLPAGRLYLRRAFGLEAWEAVWAAYRRREGTALKQTPRTTVTLLQAAGNDVILKAYHGRGGRRRGLRAWRAGHGLKVRGIPAATPLAYLAGRDGRGYLVMARAPGRRLDHLLLSAAAQQGLTSRRFRDLLLAAAAAVAHLLRRLHEGGVYHGDLKACNLYAQPAGAGLRLTLVDYDRVVFSDRPLSWRRRVKNLAQLEASLTRHVNRPARLRCLRTYASPALWASRRRLVGDVARACARKWVVTWEPIE